MRPHYRAMACSASSMTVPGRLDLSDRVIPEPPQPGRHQACCGDLAFLRAMIEG